MWALRGSFGSTGAGGDATTEEGVDVTGAGRAGGASIATGPQRAHAACANTPFESRAFA